MKKLGAKVRAGGPTVLWHGASGAVNAKLVGHYPWFATYSNVGVRVPKYEDSKFKVG